DIQVVEAARKFRERLEGDLLARIGRVLPDVAHLAARVAPIRGDDRQVHSKLLETRRLEAAAGGRPRKRPRCPFAEALAQRKGPALPEQFLCASPAPEEGRRELWSA